MSPGAHAGAVSRTAAHHPGDQDALRVGELVGICHLGGQVVDLDPDPSARHRSGLDDLLHDLARQADGDREPDAHGAAAAREDRGVDADQVARAVYQRAARVAGVDGGIGLNEVFERVDAEVSALQRADDPHRHGLADAEGVADRQHHVADVHMVQGAEGDRRQVRELDLEHREVAVGIGAHDAGAGLAAVVERNLDLIGLLDHVVVGEDVALGPDDDPGTEAGCALRLAVQLLAEETAEQRIVHQRVARDLDFLAGGDVHHRRHRLARPDAVGAHGGAGLPRLSFRARLGDGDYAAARLLAWQEVGPQRGDHEQDGQCDRGRLSKDQPELAHRMAPGMWRRRNGGW